MITSSDRLLTNTCAVSSHNAEKKAIYQPGIHQPAALQHLSQIRQLNAGETPSQKIQLNFGHECYETDYLPRIVLLCPQGGITFKDQLQCLGTGGPDFGGQLVYLKALAPGLREAGFPAVDIVTRAFTGRMPDGESYPSIFNRTIEHYPQDSNIRVVRLPCGGQEFLPKEQLWPHLREWTNKINQFYTEELKNYQRNNGKDKDYICFKPVLTAHYADAGLAAHLLRRNEGYPFATMTAHSLGAQKKASFQNLSQNLQRYKFNIRIPAENRAAKNTAFIVCNSEAEKNDQWHAAEYKSSDISDKLTVIAPGISDVFGQKNNAYLMAASEVQDRQNAASALQKALAGLEKNRQGLPTILMCGRFDRKKGYKEALQCFAQSEELKAKANIVLLFSNTSAILENPDDYLNDDAAAYAHEIKQLIEDENLKDYIVMPDLSEIRQTHLSEIYRRLSGNAQSIYCHAAFTEPFGLAILEALSEGMLIAATDNGGAVSILDNGRIGQLMNVRDFASIEAALLKILDMPQWAREKLQRMGEFKAQDYRWAKTGHEYAHLIIKYLAQL